MPADSLRSKLNPVHITAQVAWTIAWTFLGGFLGVIGTGGALLLGAASSQVMPVIIEHFSAKSGSAVRARVQQLRLTRMNPEEALRQARREQRERAWRSIHWKVTGLVFVIVTTVTLGAITAIEAGAGKPVSDIVQGKRGHGFSFHTEPVQAPPRVYSSPAASSSPVSPSPSISETGSTTSPSPAPSVTLTGGSSSVSTPPPSASSTDTANISTSPPVPPDPSSSATVIP